MKTSLLIAALLIGQPLFSNTGSAHRLVFLGDSLTAGYGLEEDLAWPSLVQKKINDAGLSWTVINAGVSGDTSQGGLSRLDWILMSRPDAVFVCLGANDGLRGVAVKETESHLDAIFAKLKREGAKGMLAGMRLPTNYGRDYEESFAAIFPRVAKRHQVPFLPFLLKGVGGKRELNLPDGIHPNEEGQRRIADLVFPFLLPYLKTWSKEPARGSSNPNPVLRKRSDFLGAQP